MRIQVKLFSPDCQTRSRWWRSGIDCWCYVV